MVEAAMVLSIFLIFTTTILGLITYYAHYLNKVGEMEERLLEVETDSIVGVAIEKMEDSVSFNIMGIGLSKDFSTYTYVVNIESLARNWKLGKDVLS